MEDGTDVRSSAFDRFWKKIEPKICEIAGTVETGVLRYAVRLGFEAGRQTTLQDFFRFVRREAADTDLQRPAPKLEPA